MSEKIVILQLKQKGQHDHGSNGCVRACMGGRVVGAWNLMMKTNL